MDKSKWYRIPEREHTNYRIPKQLLHTRIKFKRAIVRAGYYFEPSDLPLDAAVEEARKDFFHQIPEIGQDTLIKILEVTNLWEEKFFSQMIYYIRGGWMRSQKDEIALDNKKPIRTFWYVDGFRSDNWVEKIVTRQIGVRDFTYGDAESGYVRNVPYLNKYSQSQLAVIQTYPYTVYVHPEDILE